MKAILCKVLPTTNTKPRRIMAIAEGGNRQTVSVDAYDDTRSAEIDAARQLATRLGWEGQWIGGGLPTGDTVFVNKGGIFSVGSFWVHKGADKAAHAPKGKPKATWGLE